MVGSKAAVRLAGAILLTATLAACSGGGGLFRNAADRTQNLETYTPEQIFERGEYDNVVNAPLRARDSGETFREAFEIAVLPRLREFGPDLIVISAGFDAHRLDPLSNLNLSEADFGWATHRIMEVADVRSAGRVISVLKAAMPLRAWLSRSRRTSW